MSRKGHFEKIRRPTNLEVYQDASKILEELLERHLDENPHRYPKFRRNKTDPSAEAQNVNVEPLSPGTRSKTMPSKFRESKEEKLKEKDLDHLQEIERQRSTTNGDGSISSADTDGDLSGISEKRRKKSLFKRAKERLIHAFHRDQKERVVDKFLEKQTQGSSPAKRRRQKKTKSGTVVSEKHRHIHAHVDNGKTSVDYTEERDYEGKDGPVHTELKGRSKSKGSIFSSFRKLSKRDSKDRQGALSQDRESSPVITGQSDRERQALVALGDGVKGSIHPPKSDTSHHNNGAHHSGSTAPRTHPSEREFRSSRPPPPPSSSQEAAPPPPSSLRQGSTSPRAPLPSQQKGACPPPPPYHVPVPPPPPSNVPVPPPPPPPPHSTAAAAGQPSSHSPRHPPSSHSKSSSPSSRSLNTDTNAIAQGGVCGISSSSSNWPASEHTSDYGSIAMALGNSHRNALDSPGEDIQYMDTDDGAPDNNWSDDAANDQGSHSHTNTPQNGQASEIRKFHDSKGLLDFSWLADRSAESTKQMELDVDETVVSRQRPDGNVEVTTTVTATHTVVLPDLPEEESFDVIDGILDELPEPREQTEEEKEVKYAQIAQRLIEMGDLYSQSMSDHESSHGATAVQPTPLTDLEKEIIECLRSSGDRNSKQFDESVEVMKQGVKEDAYQRFRSTIQNSLGSELSWHHIAFLFYTTKGVVSAVGKGSRMATDAKDFTLKYTTETFASWIMDQGGFDSMLSSSESDYELD